MDSNCTYKFVDKNFVAVRGDSEKIVAKLADGKVVYEKGAAGPHKANLEKWIAANGLSFAGNETPAPSPAPDTASAAEPEEVPLPEDEKSDTEIDSFLIDSIPAAELPPFTKIFGVATPGFREWCRNHKLNEKQIELLVKRLEKGN
ncbi:MAG: hypothetical protein MJ016_02140 [Victivallaceae bacterium]|nr:hypothetical protein [Victivallaceae bacterium]